MISVEHLTKYYGDVLAVDDISFEIEEGHIYGFLGPNGAGKSTTMNIMTGCLSATSGKVFIGTHDIYEEPNEAKKLIGYLPEQPPLYPNETPLEYLKFVGEAKGLKGEKLKQNINEVIGQVGLDNVKNKLISSLSKGYKQRVGIAQALLGDPKVIILDEPTVGLDPIQIIDIRELIKELGKNRTIIFSSHILSEVQEVCEKVLIISGGKLVAFDSLENLEQGMSANGKIIVKSDITKDAADEILSKIVDISDWAGVPEDDTLTLHIETSTDDTKELCRKISLEFASKGYAIYEISSEKTNLENVFLKLTENTPAQNDTTESIEEEGSDSKNIDDSDNASAVSEKEEE